MPGLLVAADAVVMPEAFTAVVTQVFTTIGNVVTTITTQPLLLIPVGIGFAGAAIGLARKLMGTGKKKRG